MLAQGQLGVPVQILVEVLEAGQGEVGGEVLRGAGGGRGHAGRLGGFPGFATPLVPGDPAGASAGPVTGRSGGPCHGRPARGSRTGGGGAGAPRPEALTPHSRPRRTEAAARPPLPQRSVAGAEAVTRASGAVGAEAWAGPVLAASIRDAAAITAAASALRAVEYP
ncbi:hypothetical protein Shyhy01_29180 [Streptomyces hygroscopicus subsp. hygroscopicus]|nr:hypothetical protein Shyhy01_29180 [Streptomyces hygroscopicus subsp. hygroscopicus]